MLNVKIEASKIQVPPYISLNFSLIADLKKYSLCNVTQRTTKLMLAFLLKG